MFRRQLAERAVNFFSQFNSFQTRCRIHIYNGHLPFHAAAFIIHFLDGIGAMPFLLPQMIEAKIDADARHPRREAGFAVKLFEPLPAFDPRFL